MFQVHVSIRPDPLPDDIEWQKDGMPLETTTFSTGKYQVSNDRRTLAVNYLILRLAGKLSESTLSLFLKRKFEFRNKSEFIIYKFQQYTDTNYYFYVISG